MNFIEPTMVADVRTCGVTGGLTCVRRHSRSALRPMVVAWGRSHGGSGPLLVRGAGAGPLDDRRAVGGAPAPDVEALSAVPRHQLHVVADVRQGPLLVGAAGAGPLDDGRTVRLARALDVEALSAIAVDHVVVAVARVTEEPVLVRGQGRARPLDEA